MRAPCKGCLDRSAECHGGCAAYQAYAEERRKLAEERAHVCEYIGAQNDAYEYTIKRSRKKST